MNANTDLIIIGGGAAGLMAAATAAEYNLSCVILEKNNRPGRKLLMCGNNRCNLSTDLPPSDLLRRYSDPCGLFLEDAIHAFSTNDLKAWFNRNGLQIAVKDTGRVYPKSERANDVVNCFKDLLRAREIPLILNSTVTSIALTEDGFNVTSKQLTLNAPTVLVATGGVTYPKTGSVGDGQRFAKELGHRVLPYRPGMAAFELNPSWWKQIRDCVIQDVALTIHSTTQAPITLRGSLELRQGLVHGTAAIDASSVISRLNLKDVRLTLDILPNQSKEEISAAINGGRIEHVLSNHLGNDARTILRSGPLRQLTTNKQNIDAVKSLELPVKGMRPLKEAMVTVGGISLDDIDPSTMMSTRHPGLYFAGEVMDIDGPCGGFNLHAAFATARLAVGHVAKTRGLTANTTPEKSMKKTHPRKGGRPHYKSRSRKKR